MEIPFFTNEKDHLLYIGMNRFFNHLIIYVFM